MIVTLAVVMALTAGYFIGRVRPWAHLTTWTDWRLRDDGRWWIDRKPRQVAIAAAFLLTHPRGAWNAWQHRNDPSTATEPAPAFDPNWAANRSKKEQSSAALQCGCRRDQGCTCPYPAEEEQ
ncbi:hypothetical protein [Streptomyces nigrescens]|uniref:hypothetical protein n=1 Tax=Streptomyces nigrescens TaxID=1920 RepID=UPI0036741BD8